MKKTNAVLILLLLAGLTALSWYFFFDHRNSKETEYADHLKKAQEWEEKQVYVTAISEYEAAMALKAPDYAMLMQVASDYRKLENKKGFLQYCDQAIDLEPANPEAYIQKVNYYIGANKIADALSVIDAASRYNIENDELAKFADELAYRYELLYIRADSFGDWHDLDTVSYIPMGREGVWGLMNHSGSTVIKPNFDNIGPLHETIPVAPVLKDGEYYFADENGYRKLVPVRDYNDLGAFGNSFAPAQCDGVYGYVNEKMEEFSFEFDYAGCFSFNVAAVRKGGKWALFNKNQTLVTEYVFDDILMDLNGRCSQYGVIIAVKDGKYQMLGIDGKPLNDKLFEELRFPASNSGWIAYREGEKWGFADRDGNVMIQPEYEDAKSFSMNLAAVKVDGKWGFININQEMIVPADYADVRPFNAKGSALVYTGRDWSLVILLRCKESSGGLF